MDPEFTKYMWDTLLQQTELTLNLLCQATINPKMSAWEYFNGPFDYAATQLVPLGSIVMIHNTVKTRKSWDQRGQEGFYIHPNLQHYQCLTIFDSKTKCVSISDTMDFLHTYLQQPTLTPEYRIVHAVQLLTCAIQYVKSNNKASQLAAIQELKNIFNTWQVTLQQEYIPPRKSTRIQLQRKPQGKPHNIQQSNTLPHQERHRAPSPRVLFMNGNMCKNQ